MTTREQVLVELASVILVFSGWSGVDVEIAARGVLGHPARGLDESCHRFYILMCEARSYRRYVR